MLWKFGIKLLAISYLLAMSGPILLTILIAFCYFSFGINLLYNKYYERKENTYSNQEISELIYYYAITFSSLLFFAIPEYQKTLVVYLALMLAFGIYGFRKKKLVFPQLLNGQHQGFSPKD